MSVSQKENGQLTIEALMKNTGLTDKQVNQEIAEKDLSKIARLFDRVDDLCEQFELSTADMADIRILRNFEGTEESVKKALKIWRKQDPLNATFKNLLIILLDSEKGVVAKDVADYISNRPQQEPTNEQPRPEEWTERQVCTLVLVLLAVGVVLLSMALYSQDHDGLPILTMTDFKQYKANNTYWWSPPVYTHHQGYKIRLRVEANGFRISKGTHVTVWVYFMRGEFDDSLKWPFRGVISVQLLDQVNGKDHKTHTLTYDDKTPDEYCTIETVGERSLGGWGYPEFIVHYELEPKYLRNNTLLFQIYTK